jgi:hypothetical protein
MTRSVEDLERDVRDTRARLDAVIESVDGRLSRMAADVLDALQNARLGSIADRGLTLIRRNPALAITAAVGAGWLLYRMAQGGARSRRGHPGYDVAEKIPVLNTGHARVYDPDASSLHPTQDSLQSRREMSARI